MKKLMLCVVMVVLSVSAAFGGATEDLFEAVQDKDTTPQKIQSLIESGANVNAKDEEEGTPLMFAAILNMNPKVVKTLIGAGAEVNAKTNDGWTALMLAASSNSNPEVIRVLLNAGANVNAVDNLNRTALTMAADSNNNPEVVKVLIDAGADVNLKDSFGKDAIAHAQSNSNPGILSILMSLSKKDSVQQLLSEALSAVRSSKTDDEHRAAKLDAILIPDRIKALISSGDGINDKGDEGVTLLMRVAEAANNPELVRDLLKAGADINAKNTDGWTPLMYAVRYNTNPEVTKTLINAGADINVKKNDGITALMLAAYNNSNPEIVKALINAGSNVHAKDNSGQDAIAYASNNSNPEIRRMFAAIAKSTENLLYIAAQRDTAPEQIKTLINAGADVNAKGSDGVTALARVAGFNAENTPALLNFEIPVSITKRKYLSQLFKVT